MPVFSSYPVAFASAANTTPVLIKAGRGRLLSPFLYNTAASARYVMLFDSVAAPTPGTSVPAFVLPLTANSGIPFTEASTDGFMFLNGLWAFVSTAGGPLGNTAGTANDVIGQFQVTV